MSVVIEQHQKQGTMSVTICALDDIAIGMGRAFEVNGRSIAVFRTRSGQVFAMDNACPHRGGPLADGMLAGDRVVCPYHSFRFELATGACDQPSTCAVRTHELHVDDDGQVRLTLQHP